MTVTKAELCEGLIHTLYMNRHDAKELVEDLFEILRHSLEAGESIRISSFGNFELRDKAQRPGRNPKTGEDVPISARRVVTFKPGQKLKARVEHYKGEPESD